MSNVLSSSHINGGTWHNRMIHQGATANFFLTDGSKAACGSRTIGSNKSSKATACMATSPLLLYKRQPLPSPAAAFDATCIKEAYTHPKLQKYIYIFHVSSDKGIHSSWHRLSTYRKTASRHQTSTTHNQLPRPV